MQIKEQEGRLVELWNRRAGLNEREWHELYVLVRSFLFKKFLDLIEDFGLDPEDCVQDFFEDKVLALNQHHHKIDHAGAIGVYYMRYIISLSRDPYRKRKVSLTTFDNEEDEEKDLLDVNEMMDPKSARDHEEEIDVHSIVDSLDEKLASQVDSIEDIEEVFRYVGLDIASIQKSALDFLYGRGQWSHLAPDSEWIQIYLKCHLCCDTEDQKHVPLSTLARRHQIPSYHMRAVKLGITVPKEQGAALESFRKSYRGQWLESLGIPVDHEHQLEMALALKILCLEALKAQRPC